MVIGVGFLMEAAIFKVATQFPNKKFAEIDGCAAKTLGGTCVKLPNVAPLFFNEQQAGYLVGAMAGQIDFANMIKSGSLTPPETIPPNS